MPPTAPPKKHRLSKNQRRLLLSGGALLAVLVVVGGFFLFQDWRARDLASKALDNYDQANYRMAWLQARSARALRADNPDVLRSSAVIESGLGRPVGLEFWNRLAELKNLSAEDLEQRARAAARFGSDEQFEAAIKDLGAAGDLAAAGRLRAARKLARGEVDDAINEVRRMVDEGNDPLLKLDLARLLVRRHVDRLASADETRRREVAQELAGMVNALQGTPVQEQALALGLNFVRPDAAERKRWATLAMGHLQVDNPALLPAATTLVELGEAKPEELHRKLRPIFDAAPLDRRTAFSIWLTSQGMPREALSLGTSQEAAESPEAFVARVEALAKMENWNGVLEAASVNGNVPEAIRFAARARAEYALGRGAQSGAKSVADSLRVAATKEGGVSVLVAQFDEIGAKDAVDLSLVDLCGDPQAADAAFSDARDRFSRRGAAGEAMLASAYQRASSVAPNSPSVKNYARYRKLMDDVAINGLLVPGKPKPDVLAVDPQETALAVQASPGDVTVRATHALALIQAGRGSESFSAFDDITIYFNRLPPPLQAVLTAAAAASGEREIAAQMREKTAPDLLSPGDKILLQLPSAP